MDKQAKPKVSIIIPVYNVEQYLPQCIESCINQTLKDIEIILVNDGSTDSSGAICNRYAQNESRIILLNQANGGLSSARNAGIDIASADYIVFLDSDDWMDKEACEIAYNSARINNADVVFWGTVKEYHTKKSVQIPILSNDCIIHGEDLNWLKRRLVGLIGNELSTPTKTDAFNSAWGKLYKKSWLIIHKIRFVDTKKIGSEDVLFNIQYFSFVQKAVYLNLFLNHYRQDNPNSLTKNHNFTLFPRFLNLFSDINSFISANKLPTDYKNALNNRIALSTINNILSITSKNNASSYLEKIAHIKTLLNNSVYFKALEQLELKYLPIHWKLFFIVAKIRSAFGVYYLGILMHKLRN